MLDLIPLFFSLGLGVSSPADRPRYESRSVCTMALAVAAAEMTKHSLDPTRFKCDEQPDGKFIILGKQRGEK